MFLKEIKLKSIFFFILVFLSFDILASSPVEMFNNLINQNLSFTQKSLNSETVDLSISDGSVIRDKSSIVINIERPFRERYTLNNSSIEIYDFDFDQTKILSYKDIDNITFIDILMKGINLDIANVKDISINSFKVVDSSSREIYIELTSADSFFIKFKDNMNIINLVKFKMSE